MSKDDNDVGPEFTPVRRSTIETAGSLVREQVRHHRTGMRNPNPTAEEVMAVEALVALLDFGCPITRDCDVRRVIELWMSRLREEVHEEPSPSGLIRLPIPSGEDAYVRRSEEGYRTILEFPEDSRAHAYWRMAVPSVSFQKKDTRHLDRRAMLRTQWDSLLSTAREAGISDRELVSVIVAAQHESSGNSFERLFRETVWVLLNTIGRRR